MTGIISITGAFESNRFYRQQIATEPLASPHDGA
jgi:hypothetical protein